MPKKGLKKKKKYQQESSALARSGRMNNAAGQWQDRKMFPDNSMKRDFMPNRGTH